MKSLEDLIQHLESQMVALNTGEEDVFAPDLLGAFKYKSNLSVEGTSLLPPLVRKSCDLVIHLENSSHIFNGNYHEHFYTHITNLRGLFMKWRAWHPTHFGYGPGLNYL